MLLLMKSKFIPNSNLIIKIVFLLFNYCKYLLSILAVGRLLLAVFLYYKEVFYCRFINYGFNILAKKCNSTLGT